MKIYLLSVSFLFALFANCQTKTKTNSLLISTNGVDSIKIGMSKLEVEKIINTKLRPYVLPDSILKNQDTTMIKNACKDCNESFICIYKGIEFALTFFRYTMYQKSDYELMSIGATSHLPVVETKTGIKVGMTEKAFIDICKRNNYQYNLMEIDKNNKGCFFTDNLNKDSGKLLMIRITNGVIISLGAVNMIGD